MPTGTRDELELALRTRLALSFTELTDTLDVLMKPDRAVIAHRLLSNYVQAWPCPALAYPARSELDPSLEEELVRAARGNLKVDEFGQAPYETLIAACTDEDLARALRLSENSAGFDWAWSRDLKRVHLVTALIGGVPLPSPTATLPTTRT